MSTHIELIPVEQCCAPLGGRASLTTAGAQSLARHLAALAEPNRLRIVAELAAEDCCGLTTRELSPMLGLTEATMSHHLHQLADSGIVRKARDGRRVVYTLDPATMRSLATILDVRCACGDACTC